MATTGDQRGSRAPDRRAAVRRSQGRAEAGHHQNATTRHTSRTPEPGANGSRTVTERLWIRGVSAGVVLQGLHVEKRSGDQGDVATAFTRPASGAERTKPADIGIAA